MIDKASEIEIENLVNNMMNTLNQRQYISNSKKYIELNLECLQTNKVKKNYLRTRPHIQNKNCEINSTDANQLITELISGSLKMHFAVSVTR